MNVDTPSSSFFNHESEIEEENLYLDLTNGDISEVVEDDSVDGYECEVEKFLKVVAVSGKSEAALAVPKSGPTDDILDLYADDFESSPVKKTTNTLTDPHPVVMEESHPTMQRERVKDAEVSPSVETTLNYTSNGNAEALEIEESGKGQHIATVSCKLVADIMARCASFCEELNSKNIVECKAVGFAVWRIFLSVCSAATTSQSRRPRFSSNVCVSKQPGLLNGGFNNCNSRK